MYAEVNPTHIPKHSNTCPEANLKVHQVHDKPVPQIDDKHEICPPKSTQSPSEAEPKTKENRSESPPKPKQKGTLKPNQNKTIHSETPPKANENAS